jgi:hypothetical protein
MEDLKTITGKINKAGLIPGFHIQHSKASLNDTYVSPVPDHRLNLIKTFTLAQPLDKSSTTLTVEENPEGCDLITEVMYNKGRVLKIGEELIQYESYTTEWPYQFTGCKRGFLGSHPSSYNNGYKFGLLDLDGQPAVRFDQRSSIQQEHAEMIGKISNEAGFRFFSYDGAEDVHTPWWYWVSMSQYKVHKCLQPEPLFSTGAAKSHFGWHILSCSNEFDTFIPEVIKRATREHQAAAARYVAQDFTRVNLGWVNYVAPGEKTIGMQPDMYEYICTVSAAWDCPISIKANMRELKAHPRTGDNLEVMRRWEEARLSNFFTAGQLEELKKGDKEYTLLINEKGDFELCQCEHIIDAAGGNVKLRAFIFSRSDATYIVFWHPSGEGTLQLNTGRQKLHLFKDLGKEIRIGESGQQTTINYGDRQYLKIDMSKEEALKLFREAKIL